MNLLTVNSMQGGTGGNGGPATSGIGGPGGTGEGPRLFDTLNARHANNYANQRNINITNIVIIPPILAAGHMVPEYGTIIIVNGTSPHSLNGRAGGMQNHHRTPQLGYNAAQLLISTSLKDWGGTGSAPTFRNKKNKRTMSVEELLACIEKISALVKQVLKKLEQSKSFAQRQLNAVRDPVTQLPLEISFEILLQYLPAFRITQEANTLQYRPRPCGLPFPSL
ncbi:hypothetical protein B0H11DRAFT_1926841 [Mycena galericulata]|nr:hypothetical protein B0H11DRAFT_1926841 [Mycena galericulata]